MSGDSSNEKWGDLDDETKRQIRELNEQRHERMDPGPTAHITHPKGAFGISGENEEHLDHAVGLVGDADSFQDAHTALKEYPHVEVLTCNLYSEIRAYKERDTE